MAKKIADALREWEENQIKHNEFVTNPNDIVEADSTKAKVIELQFQVPLIKVMDNSLSNLISCEKLSLSTNSIDKIAGINGMKNLKILALGRNNIKFLTGLDAVADTLEQLWISYNLIEKLNGIEKLLKLKIFYASNNKIKDWTEVVRLGGLPLTDVVLRGNPIRRDDMELSEYQKEVKKRIPGLKILDGEGVGGEEEDEED